MFFFLSLSTSFILISLSPFPLPEPSSVTLHHSIYAIYSAYAHTLCTASRWPNRLKLWCKYINILAGSMRVGETFIKKNKKYYAAMHRNPSHQQDNQLRWYRLSKDEAPSCDLFATLLKSFLVYFHLAGRFSSSRRCTASTSAVTSPPPPLPRSDSGGGGSCQRSHRRGHEGQKDQAGGDEQLPQ